MRGTRLGATISMVALVVTGWGVAAATPAFAAVPSNDTIQTATEITSIPFTDTVDTTQATTDALETSLDAQCGAPTVEHGVWYHATVTESGNFTIDVTQSNFNAGIMVIQGPVGSPTVLTCGPGEVTGPATAGQDLFLLIFGDGTGPTTSGTMVLTITAAPPPPTVDLTINPRGTFGHDGSATISGTITCTGDGSDGTDVFGNVSQRVGRLLLGSFFDTQPAVVCDGAPHPWSGTALAQNGLFGGGHANVDVTATVCGAGGNCNSSEATTAVQLSGGGSGNGKH